VSFTLPQSQTDLPLYAGSRFHVPADAGVTKWVFGDTYTMKLTAQQTSGSLGLVEASVPPGGGPVAHTHAGEDEIFYLLSGELEFLSGDQTFTARPGDVVFIPRTVHHRFRNIGIRPASMLFMYTPAVPRTSSSRPATSPSPARRHRSGAPSACPCWPTCWSSTASR